MGAVTVITLGCRLNAYESEVMRAHAEASGRETVIVNTCAVTAEAERQARQAVRRARREHPSARLVVTGCSAQIDPGRYATMPEVDQVLGNAEKMEARSFLDIGGPRVRVNDIASIRDVGVPDTIEDAVLARTATLSPEAQAVARAGAVMGRCFVPEVLAGVMDIPVAELDEPLEELVGQAILYPFGEKDVGYHDFRHQLLRDALYRHTPARERRRYHARAAEFGGELVGSTDVRRDGQRGAPVGFDLAYDGIAVLGLAAGDHH